MKKAYVETYKASATFRAPLEYVFQWCTDFREDDGDMVGSKAKRTFLEKTDKRIVWIEHKEKKGKSKEGVRVVWLHPPDAWYLDTCGDGREVGQYKLTGKGKNKTRLDMEFRITYDSKHDAPDKKKWEKDVDEEWESFASHLEDDFRTSLQGTR